MLYIQNFIVFQTQQVSQHFLGGWVRRAIRSPLILRCVMLCISIINTSSSKASLTALPRRSPTEHFGEVKLTLTPSAIIINSSFPAAPKLISSFLLCALQIV